MTKQTAEDHKTALITGASSGIGYELARLFAQSGHDLVLVARNKQRLDGLAKELTQKFGVNATVLAKDLSEPAAAGDIVTELQNHGFHIDVLVNNAGFGAYGPLYETSIEMELQMIQVNITTLTQLTRVTTPRHVKEELRQDTQYRLDGVICAGSFRRRLQRL